MLHSPHYGRESCGADRLPAGALDEAVVVALLAAYDDGELLSKAAAEAAERAQSDSVHRDGELRAVEAELAKVEAGIDRYLRAFETGAMPDAVCGTRVKELGDQAAALRQRRDALADEATEAQLLPPTPEGLTGLRDWVADAVATGSSATVKALPQSLVHEIRVESRHAIRPVFRVLLEYKQVGHCLNYPAGNAGS